MNILVRRCFFVKRATLSDSGSFGVIKKWMVRKLYGVKNAKFSCLFFCEEFSLVFRLKCF